MTTYQFQRESNDFKDILEDPVIKKKIVTKISWKGHVLIKLDDYEKTLDSYIILKYGDDLRNHLVTDRTPVPFVDYQPKEPKWLK
jgi:hypothetical protein